MKCIYLHFRNPFFMPPIKKSVALLIFLLFYPVILFVSVGYFYSGEIKYFIKEIVEFFIFTGVVYTLGIVITRGVFRLFWFYLASFFLFVIAFFKTAFYYLYQSKLTISAFYIIFETTGAESSGYLYTYYNRFLIILTLISFTVLFLCWMQLGVLYKKERKWFYLPSLNKKGYLTYLILFVSIVGATIFVHQKLKPHNILFLAKDAYVSYKEAQKLFQTKLVEPNNSYIKNVSAHDTPQTYVVIIGESTSARNMGLYGYYRNTNPLLSEIKDELFIFTDVISPHTHTISSLNKMLSLANYENPDVLHCGSIVQLANAAGFSTYWLSNQQPIGINETLVTSISRATKEQIFTNALINKQLDYDEVLLPHLEKLLKYPDDKKVIFIHLYGTHLVYKFSYPPHFGIFTDTPQTKFPSTRSFEQINHYDNSIVYNDFIVRSIIEKVRATNQNAYVMYFSDHGDEVFQDMDFVGHSEYHGSNPMYEIPFIIWTSEKFREFNPHVNLFSRFLDRKYMLDDLIHSFSDLSQIKFNQFQPERSIFNEQFKYRNRMLNSRVNFDDR